MGRRNQQQRIFTILGAAVGTGLAVYGIRRLVQRRQMTARQYEAQIPERSWITEGRFQPIEEQDRSPIPTTGAMPAAPDMTREERINSDRVSDFDERGTAFSAAEMSRTDVGDLKDEDTYMTGSPLYGGAGANDETDTEPTRGYSSIFDQPSGSADTGRMPNRGLDEGSMDTIGSSGPGPGIGVSSSDTGEVTPGVDVDRTTGRMGSDLPADTGLRGPTATPGVMGGGMGATGVEPGSVGTGGMSERDASMDQTMPTRKTNIIMDEVVGPLIEHSIAFHSVMNLLRSRQRDGEGNEGIESLTEGDRNSMRAVLDQMQENVSTYDDATLRRNPLAMRSHKLTMQLRDALNNLDYTGTDLYRIYEELRPQLCSLARELDNSGQVTITGLDHIRQLYEC